ncbi:hypothetical protein [Actinoplanes aureus]|uniref:Uncharacterized protein n=1 Tax=Actinoplanes aureus TaxID=2792083 RepID=A0A931CG32_9ACTN|nr:hypothetical protein [Actinoplanes aureus]MBG0567332.1 hypothetical protein [Actinoplanes aureus]
MPSDPSVAPIPIVCDLTNARDTAEERMAEYGRLFAQSLAGRERTGQRVRLRFRADDGVEAWVRDLAAREKACCPFYDFRISAADGEVRWDIGLVDGVADSDEEVARAMLDEFYDAPDNVAGGVAGMKQRLAEDGIAVTTSESGTVMRFNRTGASA